MKKYILAITLVLSLLTVPLYVSAVTLQKTLRLTLTTDPIECGQLNPSEVGGCHSNYYYFNGINTQAIGTDIKVRLDLPPLAFKYALVHEIGHAYFDGTDYPFAPVTEYGKTNNSENVADAFTHFIMDPFFKDEHPDESKWFEDKLDQYGG